MGYVSFREGKTLTPQKSMEIPKGAVPPLQCHPPRHQAILAIRDDEAHHDHLIISEGLKTHPLGKSLESSLIPLAPFNLLGFLMQLTKSSTFRRGDLGFASR